MRYILLTMLLLSNLCHSQDVAKSYQILTKKADALFDRSDFKNAIKLYVQAFNENNGLGKVIHRYKAASCYSVLNNIDSAYFQLEKIVTKGNFTQVELLTNDPNFKNLFTDPRWVEIVNQATVNRQNAQISQQ